jgi:protein-S-isoprenylcysteine O-methyltransferase Ste14
MNSVDTRSRVLALLGTGIFLFVAPGTVAGVVPWWMSRWRVSDSLPGFMALRVMGALWMAVGFVLLMETFVRFAIQGIGTPAPLYPTNHLVVKGSYRHVRNPMYVAVVSLILGEAMVFGNVHVFIYGLFVWLAMHMFVLLYEEPTLRRTFAQEYVDFCAHVPRWIPRLTPRQF